MTAEAEVRLLITVKNVATPAITTLIEALEQVERVGNRITAISQQLVDVGKNIALAGVAASATLGVAVNEAANFESAMSQVLALTQANEEQFTALNDSAKELGRTTKFSAEEAAGGMKFLAQAGFETNEIISAMPTVLDLAAAANLDLAQSADIVTNIMAGFGVETKDLEEKANVLTKAFTSANTDLIGLGQGMKFVGPISKSMGVSFEETSASLGTLADAGIQFGTGGTALRQILIRLAKPSAEAEKELSKLGITLKNEQGNFIGISNVMGQFQESLESVGGGLDKTGILAKIFGSRQAAAAAILIDSNKELATFTEELNNSGNIMQKIVDDQLKNLTGSFTLLSSAVSGFLISVGEPFLAGLRLIALGIGGLINLITSFKEALGPVGDAIVLTLGAAAAAVTAFGLAIIALGTILASVVGFTVFKLAVGALLPLMTALGIQSGIATAAVTVLNFAVNKLTFGALIKGLVTSIPAIIAWGKATGFAAVAATPIISTIALVAAAFAGFQLGNIIKDMELFGVTIEDIATGAWLTLFSIGTDIIILYLRAKKAVVGLFKDTTDIENQIKFEQQYVKELKNQQFHLGAAGKAQSAANAQLKKTTEETSKAVESNQKFTASIEDITKALEEGSEALQQIRQAELTTFKANLDLETALEKQRVDEGIITQQEFLNKKLESLQDFTDRSIALKQQELDKLAEAPSEENIAQIRQLEEQIQQIKIASQQEQLKIELDLQKGIKTSKEETLANFQVIAERELSLVEANNNLKETKEQIVRDRGLQLESEFLQNKFDRQKEFQEKELELLEQTLTRTAQIEDEGSEEFKRLFAERENLQLQFQATALQSEQTIANAKVSEQRKAAEVLAKITGDRSEIEKVEADEQLALLKGFFDQRLITAQQFIEARAALENEITEAVKQSADEQVAIQQEVASANSTTFASIAEGIFAYQDLSAVAKEAGGIAGDLVNTFEKFSNSLTLGAEEAAALKAAMSGNSEEMIKAATIMQNNADIALKFGDDLSALRRSQELTQASTQLMNAALAKQAIEARAAALSIESLTIETQGYLGIADAAQSAVTKLASNIEKLQFSLDSGLISQGEFNASVREMREQFDIAVPAGTKLNSSVDKVLDAFKRGSISIDDFTQSLRELSGPGADVNEILQALSDELAGNSVTTAADAAGESMGGFTGTIIEGAKKVKDIVVGLGNFSAGIKDTFVDGKEKVEGFGASLSGIPQVVEGLNVNLGQSLENLEATVGAAIGGLGNINVDADPNITKVIEDNRQETIIVQVQSDIETWYHDLFLPVHNRFQEQSA